MLDNGDTCIDRLDWGNCVFLQHFCWLLLAAVTKFATETVLSRASRIHLNIIYIYII